MDASQLTNRMRALRVSLWVLTPLIIAVVYAGQLYLLAFGQSIGVMHAYEVDYKLQTGVLEWLWLAESACTNSTDHIVHAMCGRPAWSWMDAHACGNFTQQIVNLHCASVSDFITGYKQQLLNTSLHTPPAQFAFNEMAANSSLYALTPYKLSSAAWISIQTRLLQLYESVVGPWLLVILLCLLVAMLLCLPLAMWSELGRLQAQRAHNMATNSGALDNIIHAAASSSSSSTIIYQSSSSSSSSTLNPFSNNNMRNRFDCDNDHHNSDKKKTC